MQARSPTSHALNPTHSPMSTIPDTVLDAMRPLVDVESRSRVRKASLCPLPVAISALTEFGRCDATTALLTAFNKMPKRWRMEARANHHARAHTYAQVHPFSPSYSQSNVHVHRLSRR